MILLVGVACIAAFGVMIMANRPVNYEYVDSTKIYPKRMYNSARMRLNTGIGPMGNQFTAQDGEPGGYLNIPLTYHVLPNGTRVPLYGENYNNMYNLQ